jgi:hypothetical protein
MLIADDHTMFREASGTSSASCKWLTVSMLPADSAKALRTQQKAPPTCAFAMSVALSVGPMPN